MQKFLTEAKELAAMLLIGLSFILLLSGVMGAFFLIPALVIKWVFFSG